MDIMSMISGVTQSVTAYKAAVDTIDEAKILSATNELNLHLIHLSAQILLMHEKASSAEERERAHLRKIHDLEEQIRKFEEKVSERERYELVEDYPGTYALRVKESCRNGEPDHYLCPGCLDNKSVKSILQFRGESKSFGECHNCAVTYQFKYVDTSPIAFF